jgi:hypothetical protein
MMCWLMPRLTGSPLCAPLGFQFRQPGQLPPPAALVLQDAEQAADPAEPLEPHAGFETTVVPSSLTDG